MQKFDLSEYSKTRGIKMQVVNKGGHTAEVDFSGEKIRLRGGSLPDNYVLAQFHFHWGGASRRGSEHTLDGKHFPMELHLVHYQDHLKNLTMAQSHPSGLAVLGYFFKIGKQNKNFDKLLKHFPRIKETDQYVDIESFPVLDLLPSPTADFYRYDGSLTTPPCHESVIWSISTTAIEIAEDQIAVFRTLYDKDNHPLVDDYRPLQPLNQRTVTVTLKAFSQYSMEQRVYDTSCHVMPSIVAILILSAVSLLFQF